MAQLQLLTFICSVVPLMPGHSAIAVDKMVYTFEDMAPSVTKAALSGILGAAGLLIRTGTGWKQLSLSSYVADNKYRPIIFQDISSRVDPVKLIRYVKASVKEGDLYGADGVCSTQTSRAIAASLYNGSFNPRGIDTPAKVYSEVDRLSIASTTTVVWADPMAKGQDFFNKVMDVTQSDYPKIFALDGFPKSSRA